MQAEQEEDADGVVDETAEELREEAGEEGVEDEGVDEVDELTEEEEGERLQSSKLVFNGIPLKTAADIIE